MGYERKRGKLARAQRAAARRRDASGFALVVGATAVLANVQYVITLDTDTQLPRDCGARARRHDGAPAQPRRASTTKRRRVTRGLRHPAAARRRQPAGRQPLALRAAVRRRAGHRSVHARGLRRLPGPVRRRLVHRQGHLRRRRVRARARGTLAREPRSSATTCSRAATRAPGWSATCELFEDYPARYGADVEPAAPLDPRRLADRCRGCCRACRGAGGGRERTNPLSALSRWKILDNLRRSLVPAALLALLAARLDGVAAGLAVDARRCSAILLAAAAAGRRCSTLLRKPDEVPLRPAPARSRCVPRARQLRAGACSRSPACRTKRSSASTRSLRTAVADAASRRRHLLEWTARERGSSGSRPMRRHRSRTCERCGSRPRSRSPPRRCAGAARIRTRLPVAAPVLLAVVRRRRRIAWWLEPAAGRARGAADGRRRRLFLRQARAPDLGVLRDLRRRRGQLAAAGQLPGASRRGRRAPHLADQHRPGAARQPGGATTSATCTAGELIERTAQHARHAGDAGAATAATSTTGTTRGRCSRCRRATCLDGRQRQPRRPPADAAPGPAGAGRRSRSSRRALFDGLARHARRADGRCGGCGRRLPPDGARAATRIDAATTRPADAPMRMRWLAGSCDRDRSLAAAAAVDASAHRPERGAAAWARALATPVRGRARRADVARAVARARAEPGAAGARLAQARSRSRRCASSPRSSRGASRSRRPSAAARRRRRDAPTAARCRGAGSRARRADRAHRAPGAQARRVRRRSTTTSSTTAARHLLAIGYNVGERRLRRQLLRPARVGGAARQLRRHRAGRSCRRSTGSRSAAC